MAELSSYTPDSQTAKDARKMLSSLEIISANRTYYVRKDGSDSNDGTANDAAHAWLTIQHAVQWISENIALPGSFDQSAIISYPVNDPVLTLQVGDGLYEEAVFLRKVQGGRVMLRGNPANPTAVEIRPPAGLFYAVTASNYSMWDVNGFHINDINIPGAVLMFVAEYSDMSISNMEWTVVGANTTVIQVYIFANFNTWWYGSYKLNGTAMWAFFSTSNHANAAFQVQDMTIAGDIAVGGAFVMASLGTTVAFYHDHPIVGADRISGKRYVVDTGSMIATWGGGASYIPGNVAGEADAATGGFYN